MQTTPAMTLAAASVLTLSLALVGCGQDDQTEETEGSARVEETTSGQAAGVETPSHLDAAKAKAQEAAASLKEAGEEAGAAAADAAGKAMDALKTQADEAAASLKEAGAKASAAAAAAAGAASERTAALTTAMAEKTGMMTQDANAKARELITQVQDYLMENDLDSAQGVMDKLAGMKDQLSESLRKQIHTLQEKMADMTSSGTAG
jgi:hypothetical protein